MVRVPLNRQAERKHGGRKGPVWVALGLCAIHQIAVMDTYRPLDDEALNLVNGLLDADHGALATLVDAAPFVSRAACLWIEGLGITLLLSDLSEHSRALSQDPRASLLVGQSGVKGDPLTHPRLTVVGQAVVINKAAHADTWRRQRPKTTLYFGFEDFRLWKLTPTHAVLNGGFGKAYRLTPDNIRLARRNER